MEGNKVLQAQNSQELVETLKRIGAERGDDIQVRFEVFRPGQRTLLPVLVSLVEAQVNEGKRINGAPWSLTLKESPGTGVLLVINSVARATLFQSPPDQTRTDGA